MQEATPTFRKEWLAGAGGAGDGRRVTVNDLTQRFMTGRSHTACITMVPGAWEACKSNAEKKQVLSIAVQCLWDLDKTAAAGLLPKCYGATSTKLSLPLDLVRLQAKLLVAQQHHDEAKKLCVAYLAASKAEPTASSLDLLEVFVTEVLSPAEAVKSLDVQYLSYLIVDPTRVENLRSTVKAREAEASAGSSGSHRRRAAIRSADQSTRKPSPPPPNGQLAAAAPAPPASHAVAAASTQPENRSRVVAAPASGLVLWGSQLLASSAEALGLSKQAVASLTAAVLLTVVVLLSRRRVSARHTIQL
eukprot:gene15334-23441_t